MMIDDALRLLPLRAEEYMRVHGWTQRRERDDEGRVCLTGALRYCDPQPGDDFIARAVFRARGRAEDWNDNPRRTESDVLAELHREITDADLEATFGPNWLGVVRLVRRAAVLTPREAEAVRTASLDVDWDGLVNDAWDAAVDAAWGGERRLAWEAAGDAVGDAVWGVGAAWGVGREAAKAVTVRDLISPDHFNTITQPWVSVIGPTWDGDA